VFVVGDLIIDHTVFVHSAQTGHLEPVSGEMAFQVQRRLDTAGGAATAARSVSVSSSGMTFLWGLLGTSQWGTFRSILETSQALDGAMHPIELRGTQDETDAPMSTVSRLVLVSHESPGQERYERKARFVDSGKVHVPLSRLNDVTYHLQLANKAHPLDVIVLDDLNAGALSPELIAHVSAFASESNIPMVVRLRRDATRYASVRARAVVCTLAEWVHLVRSIHDADYWKRNITKSVVADEFARLSLFTFPKVDSHIVLVGDDWIESAITIEPAGADTLASRVCLRSGVPIEAKGKSHQVGTSDIFTGIVALELAEHGSATGSLNLALDAAVQVAEQYQRTSWHRIPQVPRRQSRTPTKTISERPFGAQYLPQTDAIELSRAKTSILGVLSVTELMIENIERLQKDIEGGWDDSQSVILVASGGSGKTIIGDELINAARKQGHEAHWFQDLRIPWNWSHPAELLASIQNSVATGGRKLLIAVDEALKLKGASSVATKGVVLLNSAKEAGVRFLFIDADFTESKLNGLRSQFGRRCTIHVLPSSWQRPHDIPYVMAQALKRGLPEHPPKVVIEAAALVSVIEWMLRGRINFGELVKLCGQITKNHDGGDAMRVTWKQLPAAVRGGAATPLDGWTREAYRVLYE
jgi:hypothetical protein